MLVINNPYSEDKIVSKIIEETYINGSVTKVETTLRYTNGEIIIKTKIN